ncbi:hypothetical protein LUZ63_008583 [Rhynchospora breviuscula]|uniref:Folate-biopterin transporter 2 n=1 Tax=Rhynchospora breviuscula TaxID=2022672 RepID=A0A9Q0CTX5_9POAL|nr:hypothetical protein LUZ63_008583 [Rhynchospora breviuscula]
MKEALEQENASRESRWPWTWLWMLSDQLHWSFVYSVISVYGICQGLACGVTEVASNFYWKDVQKLQPSQAQFYDGMTWIPWIVKPVWGLLTDVVPVRGYRRRPYFILAGAIGILSTLTLSLPSMLPITFAVVAMTLQSAGTAISDVTVDALVVQNSITHPSLSSDMQSLCSFCESIGGLVGYAISGLLVQKMGSQGVLGLLSIPSAVVFSVGVVLKETHIKDFSYNQVHEKFLQAGKSMWSALKCPEVWRPCLYMYLSLALSLDISVGMFYWYCEPIAGPKFSEGFIGLIYSIGSIGTLLAALLYQSKLKNHPFRSLLLWGQILTSMSGMLDLLFVLRLNLNLHIPDHLFGVIDSGITKFVGNLKWMPLMVLSCKLCPPGVEGTFFALLMSIDNAGFLSSSWAGGLLLNLLKVTREEFGNLWIAVLIRNVSRLLPLGFLFLVPNEDQDFVLLPPEIVVEISECVKDNKQNDIELASCKEHSQIPVLVGEDSELVSLIQKT